MAGLVPTIPLRKKMNYHLFSAYLLITLVLVVVPGQS